MPIDLIKRNKSGQFVEGNIPHNKGEIGYTNNGSFKSGHKFIGSRKNLNFQKGMVSWNRGIKRATNTGRTHFKKGCVPWNDKGGITKTRAYHNFYNRKRENQKKEIIGSHTFEQWEELKKKYNYMCLCCKKTEPEITLSEDHIVPVSKGGTDYIDNIQPLCRSCNSRKYTKIINYIKTL